MAADESEIIIGNVENEKDEHLTLLIRLSPEDPLSEKKKKVVCARGFSPDLELEVPISPEDAIFKLLLQAARSIHLDEGELYFNGLDPLDYYSPRNELQSLNSILKLLTNSITAATHNKINTLNALYHAAHNMLLNFPAPAGDQTHIIHICTCPTQHLLLHWAKLHGLKTQLQIAHVQGAGRGAIAINDLKVGDTALEIPQSIIISEDLLYDSHTFHIMNKLDCISPETMMLLWSMKERYNSDSKYKMFFDTLPESFNTGLSFGIEALAALEGTLLFEEIIQAKEHLRMQYDVLCPALCSNHPDIFQPDLYTWDKFLWACELWYSNSMKVMFTDGKLKTCLVPVAGLLNHSPCPHILHYGRIDSATKSLKFSLSRPCREGEQCFLSYGNYSSSHLITFYGFLPTGENLYDVIPLDIDGPQDNEHGGIPELNWTMHMVRGTWLSSNHDLFYYGLPPPLLNYLRTALNEYKAATETHISIENEMSVLETIRSIFSPMMEGFGGPENIGSENVGWDVKLALEYKDLQRKIVTSVLASCSAGVEKLKKETDKE